LALFCVKAQGRAISEKFPINFPNIGNLTAQTGSMKTASSASHRGLFQATCCSLQRGHISAG
jgi:hypothetical protein